MKKKSGKRASEAFKSNVKDIEEFLKQDNLSSLSDGHLSWTYDYAIIRLYREFEKMILNCLIAAINNDTTQLSKKIGIDFPKHLTDDVCEYIILGRGYFDFKGRAGLIGKLKQYLTRNHYLVETVSKSKYKDALERLSTLRNYAAHDSVPSKKSALESIGQQRMASSGAWLKKQDRFKKISDKLKELADDVNENAPY